MKVLILNNWEYLIPIVLLMYSIIMCFVSKDYSSEDDKQKILTVNVKRLYYSGVVLGYMIFINYVDVTTWCSEGLFGINAKLWSYCVSIIIALIIAILLDNFIISGFIFNEIGFFGFKLIKESFKEEAKETFTNQYGYILSLEASIETLHKVPLMIDKLFYKPETIEAILNDGFDIIREFAGVVKYFYKMKKIDVSVDAVSYEINKDDIKDIVEDYSFKHGLTRSERKEFKDNLNQLYSIWYINKKEYTIFNFNAYDDKTDIMHLISIKSFHETNFNDAYMISHYLKLFMQRMEQIKESNTTDED